MEDLKKALGLFILLILALTLSKKLDRNGQDSPKAKVLGENSSEQKGLSFTINNP